MKVTLFNILVQRPVAFWPCNLFFKQMWLGNDASTFWCKPKWEDEIYFINLVSRFGESGQNFKIVSFEYGTPYLTFSVVFVLFIRQVKSGFLRLFSDWLSGHRLYLIHPSQWKTFECVVYTLVAKCCKKETKSGNAFE